MNIGQIITFALLGIIIILLIVDLIRKRKSAVSDEKIQNISNDAVIRSVESAIPRVRELLDSERKNIHIELEGNKNLLNDLVREIKKDIYKSDEERVRSFTALKTELESYKEVTGDLKLTTDKLRNLLSNNQLRGAFGEQIADNLLKTAGFVVGQDYCRNEAQASHDTRPDFTIFLPDKTKINIDVKFPYSSLVKSVEADDPQEKKKHFQLFKQDVKEKIKQICTREYINPEDKTVDFVILFIPNEMIFSYIYENMADVWEEAIKKKVIFAGPFSFTAILRMVKQAYTNFRYQENLQNIIGLIHRFDTEYQKFSDSVNLLGDRIASSQKQFEVVSSTRNRQLSSIVDKIKNQQAITSNERELLDESSAIDPVN